MPDALIHTRITWTISPNGATNPKCPMVFWALLMDRCATQGGANDAVNLSTNKSMDVEEEVKVVGKSLRSLAFRKMMKKILLHCHPLKDEMKVQTICFVDIF